MEYANSAFAAEVQEVDALCVVRTEVQQVNTTTSHLIPAVQLLYLYTSYTGTGEQSEIQRVVCDANGGSFRLVFNGYTTAPIAYDANAATITAALNQLSILSTTGSVAVTFGGTVVPTTACFSRITYPDGYFQVTFNSMTPSKVTHMGGNLPLMTAITNSLMGSRYIAISEYQRGKAALGGSFRLSFRGAITNDIYVTNGVVSNLDIENALNALPTVPGSASVGVTVGEDTTVLNYPQSHLFRITFTIPELQGNVQSILVVPR